MDAKFRNDTIRELDEKKIEAFCVRNASSLVRADPEEVVRKWLDWYYARYQVDEQDEGFFINDMDNQCVVAFVSKDLPRAFVHAYELFESLNKEIEAPFVSIEGRPISIEEMKSAPTEIHRSLISQVLKNMEDEE